MRGIAVTWVASRPQPASSLSSMKRTGSVNPALARLLIVMGRVEVLRSGMVVIPYANALVKIPSDTELFKMVTGSVYSVGNTCLLRISDDMITNSGDL